MVEDDESINTIRYDTIRYVTIRYDTIRYDTIRYDTIRYDTIRYDTIRYDTIRYNKTLLSQKGNYSGAVLIKYINKIVEENTLLKLCININRVKL